MKDYIYEIEKELVFNVDKTEYEYRVKFKKLYSFLWFKWYGYQSSIYIDKANRASDYLDAYVAKSEEEIENFLQWVKQVDGTL